MIPLRRHDDLILDVGMHAGRDTEFYLLKGFRVVAVEAHPALVRQARAHFADALASGRLEIHNVAIADHAGEIDFYANEGHDDWGTTSSAFAARNARFGSPSTIIKVPCTRFADLLEKTGIPHYLKVDIEGADTLCLGDLAAFDPKPRYVSIEAGLNSAEETSRELSLLRSLGYAEFKIVNQATNDRVRCPNPPLEGRYVDHRFDGFSSGPFGEEAPGRWMGIDETFRRYRRLLREMRYFGADGRLYGTPLHTLYEKLKGEPVGWYDFHARQ